MDINDIIEGVTLWLILPTILLVAAWLAGTL